MIEWAESEYVEPSVDWSNVPVDTKILVSEDSELWYRRYFSKFKMEKYMHFLTEAHRGILLMAILIGNTQN